MILILSWGHSVLDMPWTRVLPDPILFRIPVRNLPRARAYRAPKIRKSRTPGSTGTPESGYTRVSVVPETLVYACGEGDEVQRPTSRNEQSTGQNDNKRTNERLKAAATAHQKATSLKNRCLIPARPAALGHARPMGQQPPTPDHENKKSAQFWGGTVRGSP